MKPTGRKKNLYGKFPKSTADFAVSVSWQWVRICKREHKSNYYCCSRAGTENELDKSKHRGSWFFPLCTICQPVEPCTLQVDANSNDTIWLDIMWLPPVSIGSHVEILRQKSLEIGMNMFHYHTWWLKQGMKSFGM